MKKLACVLAIVGALGLAMPAPADAGAAQDAALALGAFAVFNQLMRGDTVLHDMFGHRREVVVRERVIVHPPAQVIYAPPPPTVIYAPPPVVYAAPPVVYAPPRIVYAPPPVVYAVPPARVVPPGHLKHTHWKNRR
jgi:hypothetical protein